VSVAALCTALQLEPGDRLLSNLAGGLVCQHVGVVPIDKMNLSKSIKRFFSLIIL